MTLAIFGYGPGLGRGVAHRFGRAGFPVAVIGRDAERAAANAGELQANGIEARPFTADIIDEQRLPALIEEIEQQLGPIEVALHAAAADMSERSASTLATTTADLAVPLALKLHSPMLLARTLIPRFREKGTLLFTSGASEQHPAAYLANFGIALAAQRAYIRQLEQELRETPVNVGLLNIGSLIEGSAAQRIVDAHPEAIPPGLELTRISGAELGEYCWRLHTERDTVELDAGFPA
ncbi:SDR family NAD(P)-dependent oxidoreductase [Nocardia sp. NPDC057227]|uniref:SDR family NAD(P)-dependent oxidoreductase n=1 Tax=Nocardia sp. NPDC057227 TaxID=3346056 RepID=UPI00364444A0